MKMYDKLISVVVPVYNPPIEKFKICLDSIFSQKYKNIEIILVDDGSDKYITDFLSSITDKRLRVFIQKNSGVSVARNNGISKAQGEYIIFVDADDYLDQNWLIDSLSFMDDGYDMICGRVIMCNEKGLNQAINKRYSGAIQKFDKKDLINVQRYFLLNTAISPLPNLPYLDLGPCGKLYKRSIIKDILFPVDITLGEDQVFNHKVLNKCTTVLITNYKAYYYIENKRSASQTVKKGAICMIVRAMNEVYRYLLSPNLLNEFYYSVLLNVSVMMSLELNTNIFSDMKSISLIYKTKFFPLYDAIHKINILRLPGKNAKLRAIIFKYHLLKLKYLYKRLFV